MGQGKKDASAAHRSRSMAISVAPISRTRPARAGCAAGCERAEERSTWAPCHSHGQPRVCSHGEAAACHSAAVALAQAGRQQFSPHLNRCTQSWRKRLPAASGGRYAVLPPSKSMILMHASVQAADMACGAGQGVELQPYAALTGGLTAAPFPANIPCPAPGLHPLLGKPMLPAPPHPRYRTNTNHPAAWSCSRGSSHALGTGPGNRHTTNTNQPPYKGHQPTCSLVQPS